MPAPISLVPPRPGDGSGICEYPDDPRYPPNEYDSESYARYIRKRRREALERKAYRAFRALFTEGGDD